MAISLSPMDVLLLNTIRRHPNLSKTEITSILDVPWSTVSTTIKDLTKYKLLTVNGNNNSAPNTTKALYRAGVTINKNFEHYVGISVGSSNIKIVFLGFDFSYLKITDIFTIEQCTIFENCLSNNGFKRENTDMCCSWCAETPSDVQKLTNILINICNQLCHLKDNLILNVTAITLTFPGHIDYNKQKIISTANLCDNNIQQANISRLISSSVIKKLEDREIRIFIDHNVKSSTVAEQEYLSSKNSNHKNMLVIYLGKGIGIGMILNNRLYRGNSNLAGQLGHITPRTDNRELEQIIRDDIFDIDNNKSGQKKFESFTSSELKEYIADNPNKKDLLVSLLADTIKNIVQILWVEDIVFTGKFDTILEEIEMDLIARFEEIKLPGLNLHHSHYAEYSAAAGAAISCFYNKYKIPFEWNQ